MPTPNQGRGGNQWQGEWVAEAVLGVSPLSLGGHSGALKLNLGIILPIINHAPY